MLHIIKFYSEQIKLFYYKNNKQKTMYSAKN